MADLAKGMDRCMPLEAAAAMDTFAGNEIKASIQPLATRASQKRWSSLTLIVDRIITNEVRSYRAYSDNLGLEDAAMTSLKRDRKTSALSWLIDESAKKIAQFAAHPLTFYFDVGTGLKTGNFYATRL